MRAITRILCPVDFSETSTQAIEQAIALAAWCRATIVALHVYTPVFAPVPGLPALDERVGEGELRLLGDRVAACFDAAAAAHVPIDVRVAVGHAAPEIVECARTLPADVIVIGTHGTGGFQRLMLGSVAEKVLRSASCAVLTVPPHTRATTRPPFARVLCPVDFSDPSLTAFETAAALIQGRVATLALLHVIEWPWPEPPAPDVRDLPRAQGAALAEFRRYVETSAAMRLNTLIAVAGLPPQTAQLIVHGKPYVEILRVAAQRDADLIVMGIHGRDVVDLTLFGSTTNHVVREAACPVLTLRESGGAATATNEPPPPSAR